MNSKTKIVSSNVEQHSNFLTAIVFKLLAVLTVMSLLTTVAVFQLASAWDEYDGYPTLTADEYYIKTSKFYEQDKLMTTETYQNTFDDNGFLVKQRVLTETEYKGDFPTDVTYTFKYDDKGRVIQYRCAEWMDNVDYQYRDNGVFIKQYIDGPAYTYNPVDKAFLLGIWKYEYDENGRRSRIYTDSKPENLDFDETLFAYEEDADGRISKLNWTNKNGGKTVETGVTTFSYTENGNTEINKYSGKTDYYEFNKDHQILEMRRIENGEVTAHWKYTYDSHGNTVVSENLIRNNREVMTYEYHAKAGKTALLNGVIKGPDGKWAMYQNGKVDTSYTGIANNDYGWWRVEKGYVNFNANGIYKNQYGWWKTKDGKVTFKETGIFKNEYGWWRVENSKVNFKANGIYKNPYGWWKTTGGKVTFKENGVFKNEYGWWKVKDSKVDFSFTGIASNKYGKWYIKDGKVDFSKNGKVKYNGATYSIKNGKVQ